MLTIPTETGDVQAYVAVPPAGSGPGVLLLHAWWGLTPYFKSLADRLASEGFVVVAPDLHYGATTDVIAEAEKLVGQEGARTQAAAEAGLAALRTHPAVRGPKLGAVGFSFGAAWALHLAAQQPKDLGAVVIFYGTYPLDFSQSEAAFQGHFAATDEYEPAENVRAQEEAIVAGGRTAEFYTYPDTGHWFVEANRPDAYNAEAAELAWGRTVAFLKKHL